MDRCFRQHIIGSENINLIDAKPGIYENRDDPQQKVFIFAEDSIKHSYSDTIVKLLQAADEDKYAVDIIDDCLVIGVVNLKNNKIAALGEFDIRLFIYNLFINPSALETNQYPNNLSNILSKLKLNEWRHGFSSVVLYPVVARELPDDLLMDLLFGRKRILYYFNADNFLKLCKMNGLDASFSTVKQAKRMRSKGEGKGLPIFDGRFIQFSSNGMSWILGEGTFHEIIYNWERPISAINRMKSMGDNISEAGIQKDKLTNWREKNNE